MTTEPRATLAAKPAQADEMAAAVQGPLEKLVQTARVEAAVGAPIVHGDSLVIPTSEVFCSTGFGVGTGPGANPDQPETGRSGGGGGGGHAQSRPVAMIILSPAGVRVEPVVDVTKVVL